MKQLMIAMLFVGMTSGMMAQKGQERKEMKEKMEAHRIAFVSERAQLTPDESKTYWALDRKMSTEMKEVRKENRSLKKLNVEEMSEEDALTYLKTDMANDRRVLDIKMKYRPELIKAVGARKYIAIMQAGRDFKKEVLREYRKDHRNGMERGKNESVPVDDQAAPKK